MTDNHSEQKASSVYAPLMLDPDEFREDLASCNWTREQEDAFLIELWKIMAMFVDLGLPLDGVPRLLPDAFNKAVDNNARNLENRDTEK